MIKKESVNKPKITLNQLFQVVFTLREVLKITFRVKPKMLLAILLINSFLGITGVISFYLEKLVLDSLINGIGLADITPVFISVSSILGLALLFSLFRNILSSYSRTLDVMLSRYFDIQMDILIGRKMSELDIATIEDPGFRDRLDKVQRESGRRAGQLIMPLSEVPQALFGFISASIVLLYIHPLISLVVVLLSLPRILVNHKFIRRRYKFQSETSVDNRIWGWVRNYLVQNRNFLELKILGISEFLVKKLRKVAFKIVDGLYKLAIDQIKARSWTYIPLSIFELGIASLLVYWVLVQRITLGTFQLYLRSLRSIQDSLAQLASAITSVYENYIYVTDLVWLLELKPKLADGRGRAYKGKNIAIRSEKVWFRYRKGSPWVLKGLDFEIKAGEKIAIVGENGAGKTTLIKLLSRFYDPEKGKIFINKNKLTEFSPNSWRKNIAVLFQQFEHYPFTAKESIGYGEVSDLENLKRIKQVASKVGIDEYIESLPLKYKNALAPELAGGVNPSTGQWQRIGIARMLFKKNSQIIILDEPTSNIDPEAEEKIFAELSRLTRDRILIFVTQRFSTVRIADRIFVIDEGRIIEQGTHKELMKLGERYAKLYNLQAKAYLDSKQK